MAKKGDTIRWNPDKQSGWIYDGTWWRHYRQGEPTGGKEKHAASARAIFKGAGTGQLARFLLGLRTQEQYQAIKDKKAERNKKLKIQKEKELQDRINLLENTKEDNSKKVSKKVSNNNQPSGGFYGSNTGKKDNNQGYWDDKKGGGFFESNTSNRSKDLSKKEKELLIKAKNNKNNNEGALHNEDKKRKNTLNLYATDSKTGKKFTTNVHTKHYKTGERLGVLTRNQRRAYEAEAKGKTFEGQVAKFEKDSKHGKPNKRETLYKRNQRKLNNREYQKALMQIDYYRR